VKIILFGKLDGKSPSFLLQAEGIRLKDRELLNSKIQINISEQNWKVNFMKYKHKLTKYIKEMVCFLVCPAEAVGL